MVVESTAETKTWWLDFFAEPGRILKRSHGLRVLDLRGWTGLNGECLQSLPITDLEKLYISGCSLAKYEGIEIIMTKVETFHTSANLLVLCLLKQSAGLPWQYSLFCAPVSQHWLVGKKISFGFYFHDKLAKVRNNKTLHLLRFLPLDAVKAFLERYLSSHPGRTETLLEPAK